MGVRLAFTAMVFLAIFCILDAAVAPVHNVLVKPENAKKKCVCMNGKWCEGEIINEIECHPNYIMVCCIQPEPEPNPPYPLYPLNRVESETKEPKSKPEKEQLEPLTLLVQKPLQLEKQPEENKETPSHEHIGKGEDSSEPSSESSEEFGLDIKDREKEPIKVTQV